MYKRILSDLIRYIMTFGSFIGYSASFPKLIKDVFCYLPDGEPESFLKFAGDGSPS